MPKSPRKNLIPQKDFDASTMHDNPALAAEFAMPDDGSEDKKVQNCGLR